MTSGNFDRVVYAHMNESNCTYETGGWSNAVFYRTTYGSVSFKSCKFENCSFINCEFNLCDILDCTFVNCSFLDSYVSGPMEHTTFNNCSFANCEVEIAGEAVSFGTSRFSQCYMENCIFDCVDFSHSVVYLCDMPDGVTIVSDVTIHDGNTKAGKRKSSRRGDV